jgi:hypothetical protein
MCVADAQTAPGEAAAAVAMLERTPNRRRHDARAAANVQHIPVSVVDHDDAARVAGEAPTRFRSNANSAGKHCLTGLGARAQCICIHMHHHLEPLRAGNSRRPLAPSPVCSFNWRTLRPHLYHFVLRLHDRLLRQRLRLKGMLDGSVV